MANAIWQQKLGVWRSILIYYFKPFNRRRLKRFYRDFVQTGDLCFDIGAHLGNRTQAFVDLGAKVVSVDPQPACMDFLKQKFEDHPNVHLEQKAVSDKAGELSFHVSQLTPTISSLAGEEWQSVMQDKSSFQVSWDYSIPVEVVTLDQLIEKYGVPAFCKIDVEDFELQVLQGLNTAIPALSYEYFSPTRARAILCIDRLEEIGNYEYNWSFGESQQFEFDRWVSADEMRKVLNQQTDADRSGDIYARLKQKK